MKKLFLAALLLLSVLPISALNPGDTIPAPLLVGHRGSSYGVENTEEAFRNGAKLGYQYVETDIKVTADTKFVLCHNDDLSSFGHSLTIASSTLEQLQAVTLTQTRSGVKYTAKLMELGEFLDLCTEIGVLPVIELKWGTGVNSNDQSNMPALVKVIQDKGYYDKAIILTSMKPCLEWLKTNHPTMELQFLTGEYWASHFDWCVEKGIDVDIQASYFDAETVAKYHEKGLKVNMWTTNTAAGYTEYTLMGCDFITTDNLDGNNLPAVIVPEPDPTTKEVPDTTAYTLELQLDYEDIAIAELEGKTIKRVVPSLNGYYLYILAHKDSEVTLIVYDHINKTVKEKLGTTNCVGDRVYVSKTSTGDVLALGNIDLTDDGVLIGMSQSIVPSNVGTGAWLYKWENGEDGIATGEAIQWKELIGLYDNGLWYNGDCGEAMAYSGTIDNGTICYSAKTATGTSVRWNIVSISGDTYTSNVNYPMEGVERNAHALYMDALPDLPVWADVVVNQGGIQAQAVRWHGDMRGVPTLIAATSVLPTTATHTPVFTYNEAHYMVAATETGFVLSDISMGVNVGEVVQLNAPALTANTTTNVAAAGTSCRGDLAIFVVRDGKISRYTTKAGTITAVENTELEMAQPRKVFENGTIYIVMPTGEKYTMSGMRVQ